MASLSDLALPAEGVAAFLVGATLSGLASVLLGRRRARARAASPTLPQLPFPTWLLDETGTVRARSGVVLEPAIGSCFAEGPWTPEGSRRIAAALEAARRSGRSELQDLAHGPESRSASLGIERRPGRDGPFSGWVVQLVFAARTREAAPRRGDGERDRLALVGRLAAGTVHEFNNVLTSVLGYAELLRRALPEDAAERLDVEEIRTAARQGSELTRRLLGFARGRPEPRGPVDVVHVFGALVRLLESSIEESVSLTVDHEHPSSFVLADGHALENLLAELLLALPSATNASGRRIHVTTSRRSRSGGGRGAAEECVLRLELLPPRSAEAALAPEHAFDVEAIERSRSAAEALGGRLEVAGAVVELSLPAVEPNELEGEGAEAVFEEGDGEVVLVVEDEMLVRRLVSTGLRQAGFRVIDASSTVAALAVLDEHGGPLDLLIADVVLPGVGGVELAERLRERYPSVGVLFVSGYGEGAGAGAWDRVTGAEFLAKPFTPAELLGHTRTVLHRRRDRAD